MSHFSVLVIGPDIEKQLAPYHEYESTGIKDEYVKEVDVSQDIQNDFTRYGSHYPTLLEFAKADGYKIVSPSDPKPERRYAVFDGDKFISAHTYTNPNSKWDWWTVGGRWSGFFSNGQDSIRKDDLAKDEDLRTYAVVKDGVWYAKGDMGWFGMSRDTVSPEEWAKQVAKMIAELPDDTLLTIVDCHI